MDFTQTDPEFAERLEQFLFEEVVHEQGQQLDDTTRYMAILASLMGCQGLEAFRFILCRALDDGFSPLWPRRSSIRGWIIWGLAGSSLSSTLQTKS